MFVNVKLENVKLELCTCYQRRVCLASGNIGLLDILPSPDQSMGNGNPISNIHMTTWSSYDTISNPYDHMIIIWYDPISNIHIWPQVHHVIQHPIHMIAWSSYPPQIIIVLNLKISIKVLAIQLTKTKNQNNPKTDPTHNDLHHKYIIIKNN